ncbi:MAG: thiamine phosphate synthase [Rikenellaceae bacterium]
MKRCIVITQEQITLSEIDPIAEIIDDGCWRVHIRKPHADKDALRSFLDVLCNRVDPKKLSMHYYHDIALEYGFGGVHGKSQEQDVLKSISCHSIKEVEENNGVVDYLFISPIFDSISKLGYKAAIDISEIGALLKDENYASQIVALGGVEVSNLHILDKAGFQNIALLGCVWRDKECKASYNFKQVIEKWK